MRRHRFYLPDAEPGRPCLLPGDEAAHALRVLRIRTGTAVAVFDGRGHEYYGVVSETARADVRIDVGDPVAAPAPEATVAVTLAMSVLKGDHMDGVVRDATMLGVHAIAPLVTARSETSLAVLERGARRARWQRIAVSSAKQCGRAVVPEIHEPVRVEDWLAAAEGQERLVCVEPSAALASVQARDVARPPSGAIAVAVGPEGGWSEEELAALSAAARCLRLGGRTLRAETAPVVVLSALFAVWGVE